MHAEIGQRRLRPLTLAPTPGLERRRVANVVATVLVVLCAVLAVTVLLLILGNVVVEGVGALSLAFFTERTLPPGEVGGGVAPAILGTLVMLGVGSMIGVPIGVGTAVYLAE